MRIPNYLKSLKKYNETGLINIAGLALGIASVLFISIWVLHELSYDKFYRNADRIYRVESLLDFTGDPFVWTVTPAPLAEGMVKDFPEVEATAVLQKGYNPTLKVSEEVYYASNFYYASPSVFDIFSFKLISGNEELALSDPYSIVISEEIAEHYFGSVNPVGRTILLWNKDLLTITGILKNTPSNSHLKIDYMIPFGLLHEKGEDLDRWDRYDFLTYVLLHEGVDEEKFNLKLGEYLKSKNSETKGVLFLNPLTRIHLYRDPGLGSIVYPTDEREPVSNVILLSAIGLIILVIACINYINLSTAFAVQRANEIGVRKVAGASKGNLMTQLFGESLIQSVVAMILALIMVVLLLPLFNKLVGIDFTFAGLLNPKNLLLLSGILIFTGIIAGIYPAIIISSFKPITSLKNFDGQYGQGSALRKTLVIAQFILSITFIFSVLVMKEQINFMQNQDMGFDKEELMVVYPRTSTEKTDILTEQIAGVPGVSGVALGGNIPVDMGNFSTLGKWDGNLSGKKLYFHMMQVDDRYLDLLGIKVISGRQFLKGSIADEVIINETAVRMMEMTDPLGKHIWNGDKRYRIAGIVRDFHFRSLREEINPVFIYKDAKWWSKMIMIKLEKGDHSKTVEKISGLVKESAPNYPVRYIFLDEQIDQYYKEEQKLETIIDLATLLAIVISCMGLFGLSAFTIRKKRKEIGIRKVYGASQIWMVFSLSKEYARLIFIAAIVALPIAYYMIRMWLLSFSYRIDIHPVFFLLSLLLATAIALVTVGFQTVKAANMNPAESIRDE